MYELSDVFGGSGIYVLTRSVCNDRRVHGLSLLCIHLFGLGLLFVSMASVCRLEILNGLVCQEKLMMR
jgi:hypothetical protein